MTQRVYEFVKNLELKGRILEVGSLDVNGNVKELFDNYTGVDMRPGKNVDVVAKANNLPFFNESFDHVLCLETLEHDDCFWKSILEMKRVLKKGGKLVITVPGIEFPKHEYPKDYWRFTKEAVEVLLQDLIEIFITENVDENVIFGCGIKPT